MRITIIGAGLAGLSCADGLVRHGHHVVLFDKGRGPGGRMSTRRVATDRGEASFDHGAQYFTTRDPDFAAAVAEWEAAGIAARWPAAGADAWVGTPAMNAPVKHLARRHDVRWGRRIDAIARGDGGWRLTGDGVAADACDAVVVAVPAEQVAPLLARHVPAFAQAAEATPSAPCWTALAAFAEPLPGGDVLRDAGPIGWAARNRAKPGRSGPESWVIQATPDWSATHLEDEAAPIAQTLLAMLGERLGTPLPPPLHLSAHRWRYARSGMLGRDLLWDAARGIGVCGDWLLGPRVESAWLSGRRLADAIGAAA